MAYQAIARKWRPKNFAELVGQDHVAQTLLNALRNDRLHPVMLFTGPRGTGKTSTARILAKSLRCPNANEFIPCGECSSCVEISEGRSIDVMEIDGASNNGVDAVRELRESVGFMPTSGRYKVYIIDEVHMLTGSAFNALLKTMEEPPAHVVFILATTEFHKIPATILSRCLKFDFRRIALRQIADQLVKISAAEGFKLHPDAAWTLAKQADGSMRDSQSLLDQVHNYTSKELSLQVVSEVLGLTDRELIAKAMRAIAQADRQAVAYLIEELSRAGVDPRVFAQDLMEQVRNAMLIRVAQARAKDVVDLPDSEIEELKTLCAPLSEEDLHLLFDITLKGTQDLMRAQESRLVLEMLLLKLAAAPRVQDLKTLLQGIPAKASMSTATPPAASARATSNVKPVPVAKAPMATAPVAPPAPIEVPEQIPQDPWGSFVHRVRKSNGLLGAMLESAHLVEQNGERLLIGVPKKMQLIFDKLKEADNVKRLEAFTETFMGKHLRVEVRQNEEGLERASIKTSADMKVAAEKKSIEKTIENHPLVRSAQEAFSSQIKSIREKKL